MIGIFTTELTKSKYDIRRTVTLDNKAQTRINWRENRPHKKDKKRQEKTRRKIKRENVVVVVQTCCGNQYFTGV